MWLILDVGNSAVKAGLFAHGQLVRTWRASSPEAILAEAPGADGERVERTAISSVVPDRGAELERRVRAQYGSAPFIVSAAAVLPFEMHYRTPATLGADRLALAAALLGCASPTGTYIGIDAGTALTFEVVADGAYRGGVIAPGPRLLRDALTRGTAQLPGIDLARPPQAIGRSTVEALQSGLMNGFLATTEGLLRQMAAELPATPTVVATGGWGAFLTTHIPGIDHYDPHLVLRGIQALMNLNPG